MLQCEASRGKKEVHLASSTLDFKKIEKKLTFIEIPTICPLKSALCPLTTDRRPLTTARCPSGLFQSRSVTPPRKNHLIVKVSDSDQR
jgi:hypothetical protein